MAVATSVASVEVNPILSASSLPRFRAAMMSRDSRIAMRSGWISEVTCAPMDSGRPRGLGAGDMTLGALGPGIKICQAFLQIECCRYVLQRQPQLYHGEGDLWLDAHDDHFCASQADHMRHIAQCADREGVHDVDAGDVHNHADGAEMADALDKRIP